MAKRRNKEDFHGLIAIGAYPEIEFLDIYNLSLEHGKVLFNAKAITTFSHTGNLVGITVTDRSGNIVWEDAEHVTPNVGGISVGDTLQFDFELDPKGHGQVERWVQAK